MPRTGDPSPSKIRIATPAEKLAEKTPLKKSYQSGDLYLAAALAACGFPPESSPQDSRVVFSWYDPSIPDLARSYYEKRLTVDACSLSNEIRQLKSLVHNQMA